MACILQGEAFTLLQAELSPRDAKLLGSGYSLSRTLRLQNTTYAWRQRIRLSVRHGATMILQRTRETQRPLGVAGQPWLTTSKSTLQAAILFNRYFVPTARRRSNTDLLFLFL